jgi:hypothetical protein
MQMGCGEAHKGKKFVVVVVVVGVCDMHLGRHWHACTPSYCTIGAENILGEPGEVEVEVELAVSIIQSRRFGAEWRRARAGRRTFLSLGVALRKLSHHGSGIGIFLGKVAHV